MGWRFVPPRSYDCVLSGIHSRKWVYEKGEAMIGRWLSRHADLGLLVIRVGLGGMFMAAFAEFIGGACVVLGLFFRVATLLLFFTMAAATRFRFQKGDGLHGAVHAIEDGVVFLA